MRSVALALSCALALAACGGSAPPPAKPAQPAPEEAVSRVGDVTIRATAIPTSTLTAEIARRYGIERNDRTALLLVGVRQGPEGQEVALAATVTVSATNLSGQRQDLALRELRSEGGLLDYVGTIDVNPPDTLRFDVTVVRADGTRSNLEFSREFYPR
jgi:hypothetical protein